MLEARKRTIFVSMQFGDETKENYKAIEDAVDDINKSHNNFDLVLRPIRLDHFKKGYSYKIDDEILELILDCGLMLADISLGNKNVYHEIGYLMGLNKGSNKPQDNFILFYNDKVGKNFHDELGFNLKALQVLKATDSNDLRTQTKNQIKKYYNL